MLSVKLCVCVIVINPTHFDVNTIRSTITNVHDIGTIWEDLYKLTLIPQKKLWHAKCLVCINFQSASMLPKCCATRSKLFEYGTIVVLGGLRVNWKLSSCGIDRVNLSNADSQLEYSNNQHRNKHFLCKISQDSLQLWHKRKAHTTIPLQYWF